MKVVNDTAVIDALTLLTTVAPVDLLVFVLTYFFPAPTQVLELPNRDINIESQIGSSNSVTSVDKESV